MSHVAALTAGIVYDRLNSVVASNAFVQAKEAFSFDLQPDAATDARFRIEMATDEVDEYIGPQEGVIERADIWIARKIKRDPIGAYRQLLVDLDLIEQQLSRDYPNLDYHVRKLSRDCPQPDTDAVFVVGRLVAAVDYDRAL